MAELDYESIIALSEDPDVTGDGMRGQPFSADRYAELADFADTLFYECSAAEQVKITRSLPVHVSARRIARMSSAERSGILSRLPTELAREIQSLFVVRDS